MAKDILYSFMPGNVLYFLMSYMTRTVYLDYEIKATKQDPCTLLMIKCPIVAADLNGIRSIVEYLREALFNKPFLS